jgi:hypothetical protein
MLSIAFKKTAVLSEKHSIKTKLLKLLTFLGIKIFDNLKHCSKQYEPILITLSGISIFFNLLQLPKVNLEISRRFFDKTIDSK